MKMQKQCPQYLLLYYHRISFPMLSPIKYGTKNPAWNISCYGSMWGGGAFTSIVIKASHAHI
jgi:hypothetical protein